LAIMIQITVQVDCSIRQAVCFFVDCCC
jgi:hypothetical protein